MTEPVKLDPLPWFAFNVGEYIKDTARLTTEAHGAYLLLMLDYYARGEPCPDDDFILAAVAKLPEEQWKRYRKVLSAFFDIREGHWYHKRIEHEIRDGMRKHAESIARTAAATEARWQKSQQRPPDTAKSPKTPSRSPSRSPSPERDASVTEPVTDTHLHKHPLITEGGERPPAEVDDLGIGTAIPKDFLPDPETSDRAKAAGMSVDDIDAEVRKFIGRRQSEGAFSHDWQGSFAEWLEREIAFRKKQAPPKAPPRIEVNNQPTDADYDRALALYRKDESKWSRHLGPEPGHAGCKVSKALLDKYGWDAERKRFIEPERKAS